MSINKMYNNSNSPLEKRPYRYKKSSLDFFCPLCRSKRSFVGSPRLSRFNYFQILLVSSILVISTFSIMGPLSLIFVFIVWSIFELAVRANFRKEIPCPYCGFDASWYKKDVVKARELVKKFWNEQGVVKVESDNIEGQNDDFANIDRDFSENSDGKTLIQ